jgi:hypothetical protein
MPQKNAAHSRPQLPWGGRKHKFRIAESTATHASGALLWCSAVHMDGIRTVGIDGDAHISMPEKMPRIAAHSSLGRDANANLESQKARAHMLPNFCHGARARIWRQREWLAALELPAFPWRKKGRARPPTALLVDFLPQI